MPEKMIDGYSSRLPEDIRSGLAAYRDNENYSTRNELFQKMRSANEHYADEMAGKEDFQGYQGMLNAFNKLYHVGENSKELDNADKLNMLVGKGKTGLLATGDVNPNGNNGGGAQPNTNNMPGNNTDSTLAILQRRQ